MGGKVKIFKVYWRIEYCLSLLISPIGGLWGEEVFATGWLHFWVSHVFDGSGRALFELLPKWSAYIEKSSWRAPIILDGSALCVPKPQSFPNSVLHSFKSPSFQNWTGCSGHVHNRQFRLPQLPWWCEESWVMWSWPGTLSTALQAPSALESDWPWNACAHVETHRMDLLQALRLALQRFLSRLNRGWVLGMMVWLGRSPGFASTRPTVISRPWSGCFPVGRTEANSQWSPFWSHCKSSWWMCGPFTHGCALWLVLQRSWEMSTQIVGISIV